MDLAVGASSDAVTSLVGKLGGLLAQQYTLIRGVRDDIRYINDEMASMQAFLTTVERAGNHHEQRRVWMKQVRDMVYDIEDINHRLGPEPRGSGRLMFLQKAWYQLTTLNARRCVASEIGNLKIWAQDISSRRMRYGVENPRSMDGGCEPEETADPIDRLTPPPQLIIGTQPVGMEDAIRWFGELFETEKQSTRKWFLAIVGIGGLGKTTLATEVYRKVGDNFNCRAFVQVSKKFNLLILLKSLVKQFHEHRAGASSNDSLDGIEEWGEKDFRKKLAEQLKDKRYLILMDDIWSVSAWQKINDSLPESKKGCTIVVTTRFKSVAAACCRKYGQTFEHKPLTEVHSYKLFRQIISEASVDPSAAAKVLIDKSGGLPLVIIIIAGLVASKLRWGPSSLTLDHHLSAVANDLRGITGTNVTKEIIKIINQCYNDLPADLKTCLLYLSIFPKSCFISRKRLIRRWISEGFIVEKAGLSVEEVAEVCFNELISRKLLLPINNTSTGKVKDCQINDMVLEYIVSKSSDENFITVVGGHWVLATMYRVRCLSVHGSSLQEQELLERMDLSHVRSFTAFESFKALSSCLAKFRVLQALDLECCRDLSPKQLKDLCKMHQLTYLSLRGTGIGTVPSEIENLEYLEVLDIRETEVKILPPSVKRLKRMAHLLAGDKSKRIALTLTEEVTEMTALETLSGVEIRGTSSVADVGWIKRAAQGSRSSSFEVLEALQSLTNLKKLSIYLFGMLEKKDKESLLSAIEHLGCCSLKFLTINDGFTGFLDDSLSSPEAPPELLHTLKLSGMLCQLPIWIYMLHSLEKLNLSITCLSTPTLMLLSTMPELFSLTFSIDAINLNNPIVGRILQKNLLDSGGEIFVHDMGFKKLQLLRFLAPMLPPLSFMEGAMPALQRLDLRFRFADGVHGVENLASLKQVFLTISSKAPKAAMEIKRLADRIQKNPPTVIIEEYNESSMEQ